MADVAPTGPQAQPKERAAELLALYRITAEDLERIRAYGKIVSNRIGIYVDKFYTWLAEQPEFPRFFSDPAKLERVKKQQLIYWEDFFRGAVDVEFIALRELVAQVHARIGLSLGIYYAAVNYSQHIFLEDLYDGSLSAEDYAATARAITKLMNLDTAIYVEFHTELIQNTIREQSESLMKMSTPVTSLWRDILMLPVVGIVDSSRAQDIMNAMLTAIAETQSRVIIMDISGVAIVDTAVANHLFKITKATNLMGCECTISGVSAAIAQTMVELGIDVGDVKTTATLNDALAAAFRATGTEVRERP